MRVSRDVVTDHRGNSSFFHFVLSFFSLCFFCFLLSRIVFSLLYSPFVLNAGGFGEKLKGSFRRELRVIISSLEKVRRRCVPYRGPFGDCFIFFFLSSFLSPSFSFSTTFVPSYFFDFFPPYFSLSLSLCYWYSSRTRCNESTLHRCRFLRSDRGREPLFRSFPLLS